MLEDFHANVLKSARVLLKTLALIVFAHPYCARTSYRNAMQRHAQARAQEKKSKHIKGFALTLLRFNSLGWSMSPIFFW